MSRYADLLVSILKSGSRDDGTVIRWKYKEDELAPNRILHVTTFGGAPSTKKLPAPGCATNSLQLAQKMERKIKTAPP